MNEDKEVKKGNGGKIGAALGAAAGAIGTVMANPLGRWVIFQEQDRVGHDILRFFDRNVSVQAGDIAYNIFSTITNTIMAYPAILPIAGGVIAAGVGALIGKKVSKSKLKHKNMKQKEPEKSL